MKTIWQKICSLAAMPFRCTIFRGPGKDKTPLAGRYTRPAKMADIEPSADYLIG